MIKTTLLLLFIASVHLVSIFLHIAPALKGLVNLLSVIIGSGVAIWGLWSWKRQIRWNIKNEISRRIMHSLYKLRDAVQIVRNPVMWINEQGYSGNKDGMTEDRIRVEGLAEAYNKRFVDLSTTKIEIIANIIDAEVLWGKKIRKIVYDVLLHARKLEVAVDEYITYARMSDFEKKHDTAYKKLAEMAHHIMHSSQPGIMFVEANPEDKYGYELENRIDIVAEYLKEHIDM